MHDLRGDGKSCACLGAARGRHAVSGENLFVTDFFGNTIGEYTTSGETVNPALISGLNNATAVAVVSASVPEASSTWAVLLLGLMATFCLKPLLRSPA